MSNLWQDLELESQKVEEVIDDQTIDNAKDFYKKEKISDMELNAYIEARKLTEYWSHCEI